MQLSSKADFADGNGPGGPGVDRRNFERFRGLCESAFLTVRRNGSLVISILAMMISTGLPELSSEQGCLVHCLIISVFAISYYWNVVDDKFNLNFPIPMIIHA